MNYLDQTRIETNLQKVGEIEKKLDQLWSEIKKRGWEPDRESVVNLFFGRLNLEAFALSQDEKGLANLPASIRDEMKEKIKQKANELRRYRYDINEHRAFVKIPNEQWSHTSKFKLKDAKQVFTDMFTVELDKDQTQLVKCLEQLNTAYLELEKVFEKQHPSRRIVMEDLGTLFHKHNFYANGKVFIPEILRVNFSHDDVW